jgi:hypothetical protein
MDRSLPCWCRLTCLPLARCRWGQLHACGAIHVELLAQPLGVSAVATHKLRPNKSLKGTATGKPLGPRSGQCHHPLRGPSAFPAAAP